MFVHFTIYHIKHNTPKIISYSIENTFCIFVEFPNENKNVFHGFGNLSLEVLEIFLVALVRTLYIMKMGLRFLEYS